MPFSIRVDGDRCFAQIVLEGAIDAPLLVEAALTLRSEYAGEALSRQLWDGRGVTSVVFSAEDLEPFTAYFQAMAEQAPAVGRRAVAVTEGFVEETARGLVELIGSGHQIAFFYDRDAAIAWLLSDDPA